MSSALSNSRTASISICLQSMSEPLVSSQTGVYIGRTSIYKMPFMLDTGSMMNPHISVIGTSGSGKTYMLKALIARSAMHLGANILILDWTGEYSNTVKNLDGREISVDSDFDISDIGLDALLEGVVSLNMSGLRQDDLKADVTGSIIREVSRQMHRYGLVNRQTHVLVLDEAWRLVSEQDELGALFREGRKYGFGIVLATQMVDDIRNEAISNSATIVIFKLQNSDDLGVLLSSGVIDSNEADVLCSLGQGSCMLHLSFSDSQNAKRNVLIERVAGAELDFYEIKGNKMRLSEKKFREETERLQLSEDSKAKLFSFIDASDRCIDEIALAKLLVRVGLKRPAVVTYMRALGLDDFSIVAAYEAAAHENSLNK